MFPYKPTVVAAIIHTAAVWEGVFCPYIWTMLVTSCHSISTAPTRWTWSWKSTDKSYVSEPSGVSAVGEQTLLPREIQHGAAKGTDSCSLWLKLSNKNTTHGWISLWIVQNDWIHMLNSTIIKLFWRMSSIECLGKVHKKKNKKQGTPTKAG